MSKISKITQIQRGQSTGICSLIPCSQYRQSIFGGMFKARFAMCFKRVVFPCLKQRRQYYNG